MFASAKIEALGFDDSMTKERRLAHLHIVARESIDDDDLSDDEPASPLLRMFTNGAVLLLLVLMAFFALK